MTRILALLVLTAGMAILPAAAAPKSDKASATAELKDLRSQIQSLQKNLAANESSRKEAADALKDSESAISEANRTLNDLGQQRQLTEWQLTKLEASIAKARINIRNNQQRLGALLQSRYKSGELEAWQLLLNQQDPSESNRSLTYYRYLARSQQDLAKKLEQQLEELNQLAEEIRQKNAELQEIAKSKQEQKQQLLDEQAQKQALVSQLSKQISTQRNQIQKLAADEKRLTSLIDRLNSIIREQERIAAQKRKEARLRAEKEAKARAEKQAKLEQEAKAAGKPAPKAEPAPAPKAEINDDLPDPAQAGAAFAALKGKMRLPARGEIVGKFGSARGDQGGTWKGLFIKAPGGQPVQAIASGRVVFAEWLRGFGNLIIIDHGSGYMSLYAANESVLRQVGDRVKPGETIATTGNSGGMGDSGVYFEIRQNSRPLDPLAWTK